MSGPETTPKKVPAEEVQPISEGKKEYLKKMLESSQAQKEKEFNAQKREDPTTHPTTLYKEKAMNSFFEHWKALPGDTAKQLTEKWDKIEGKDLDALVGVIDGEIKSYRKKVNDAPIPGVFSPDDLKWAEKRRLQDIVNNGWLPDKAKAYIQEHYNLTDEKEVAAR